MIVSLHALHFHSANAQHIYCFNIILLIHTDFIVSSVAARTVSSFVQPLHPLGTITDVFRHMTVANKPLRSCRAAERQITTHDLSGLCVETTVSHSCAI
jgi:hypothetical protein